MVVAFFSWWYGAGWRLQIAKILDRLAGLSDFFSISMLLKTLFSPFRQISVGRVDGPLGVQLQAFADKLISRCIGALIRTVMIIVGCLALSFYSLWAVVRLASWPILPLVPLLAILLTLIGWVPWK